ncbi:hypothetical protein THICB3110393 [Thiomonas sp. CB3]|nr:hypothetical protein THICB3110393 [Thiomonas sp. CB3]
MGPAAAQREQDMAEDSAQEKELPASQKRKQQAREKGQVARSRDLTSSLLLLGMAAVVYIAGGWFYDMGRELLQTGLTVSASASQDPAAMLQAAGRVLVLGLMVLAPVLALTFVASAAGGVAMGGLGVQHRGAGAGLQPSRPGQGYRAHVFHHRAGRVGQGAAQGHCDCGDRWHRDLERARRAARPAAGGASTGADAARPDHRPCFSVDGFGHAAGGGRRCAVAVVPDEQKTQDEPPGPAGRNARKRGQSADQTEDARVAARARPQAHDGRRAQGRCGGDQPDALCRGAGLQRGQEPRPGGVGSRGRSSGCAHSRNCRRAQRAGDRSAAAGARALPPRRTGAGDSGGAVQRRGAAAGLCVSVARRPAEGGRARRLGNSR